MREQHERNGLQIVRVRLVGAGILPAEHHVSTPEDAARLIMKELSECDREVVGIMNMASNGSVINFHVVSVGTLNASLIHPREAFKASILSNASSIIMFHNHPSGSLKPSGEDIEVTRRMEQAGELLGISLLDHVIVGAYTGSYYSMKEGGYIHENIEITKDRVAGREQPEQGEHRR